MKRRRTSKLKPSLVAIIACLVLFFSVISLMRHVQNMLYTDVRINLTEIVTQNKDVISSKILLEMNNMKSFSTQLGEQFAEAKTQDTDVLDEIFIQYADEKKLVNYAWTNKEGRALYYDRKIADVAGRQYFRKAMKGIPNISERTVSRMDGEDIFVICVPLEVNGEVIGAVQKQYSPKEMYEICSLSLFSEQGFMYIINSEGYILISSEQNKYNRESDNYYRIIFSSDPEASKRLENDIREKRAGFLETEVEGEKVFSAYTPIEQVYDWYLISSIPTTAISGNTNNVINIVYAILLGVVLFFAIILYYFLSTRKKEQARLESVAFVDSVTGGNTITKFILDVQSLLRLQPQRQFYILAFDIDNFKYINSYYGFDAGDGLLRKIYEQYAKKLGPNEEIARRTGDRFVLFLTDASEERLAKIFDPEMKTEDITVYLSAGLYPISDHGESVSLMIDKATMAAQKIKGMRYKRVERYSEAFDRQMVLNEQIKRSVELALGAGEIVPFFQPKVDINTRKLVGAEALARWYQKDGKIVSPADFIPVCEKTGLIVAVDMEIFEKTLQFIRKNLDEGRDCVPISSNFSRMHLLNENFLRDVIEKIRAYEIPPHLVELELTESAFLDNYELMKAFIANLHNHGVQISMDDFGSGYSSLHMLKNIDIDVLKIDGQFLRDTEHSDRQKIILSAIAKMAQQLEIKVVVEGVETEEHVAMLQEFGCSIAQGYFYARPMNEGDFQKICKEGIVC